MLRSPLRGRGAFGTPMSRVYRSIDVARACNIHVNTLRFYERIGLISTVPREKNNYRRFDTRHLFQVRMIRLLYDGEWPGRALRNQARQIIVAMKEWDLRKADAALADYRRIVETEHQNAAAASELLRDWYGPKRLRRNEDENEYTMRAVAGMLLITTESIRNWERNGLVTIPRRGPNNKRYLTEDELNRLRIIAVLRKAGHSLSVIHRSVHRLREDGVEKAVGTFHNPDQLELLSSGDHYIEVLQNAEENALRAAEMLAQARSIS